MDEFSERIPFQRSYLQGEGKRVCAYLCVESTRDRCPDKTDLSEELNSKGCKFRFNSHSCKKTKVSKNASMQVWIFFHFPLNAAIGRI